MSRLHQHAKTPERIMLDREDRAAARPEQDEFDLARKAFLAAFHEFGRSQGYHEAKGLCAMLASANLTPEKNDARAKAERAWKGRAA